MILGAIKIILVKVVISTINGYTKIQCFIGAKTLSLGKIEALQQGINLKLLGYSAPISQPILHSVYWYPNIVSLLFKPVHMCSTALACASLVSWPL